VVRLKGGDPMIFGRAGEEIVALRAAGIAVEIIPGVTAASGAAASLGLSLTLRDTARRLQFVTAHARGGQLPDDFDWRALADPAATTIVYMGVATLDTLTRRHPRDACRHRPKSACHGPSRPLPDLDRGGPRCSARLNSATALKDLQSALGEPRAGQARCHNGEF
jgi:hypothetical protein